MAKRYLDPKADLTFKRVFGEHPDLVISLLNALLPFTTKEEEINSVEYLSPEMVPENPLRKFSIVDVRCKDNRGRQFIVEMQMVWSHEFMQRVMFNSAKAYVRQLDKTMNYHLLEPVYSLNIVNQIFMEDTSEYYHYYRMVHEKYTEKVIDGLHLVFVELPKFVPQTITEKKMHILWLRYLTEIDGYMESVPSELINNPEISKAITVVEESAYSMEQLLGYDHFWDIIRTESTYYESAHRRGITEGRAEGIEKGRAEGIEKGRAEGIEKGRAEGIEKGRAEGIEKGRAEGIEKGRAEGIEKGERNASLRIAQQLKREGVDPKLIASCTGLSLDEIEKI